MEQQNGTIGFIIYKDRGGIQDLEVLRDDTGTAILFADYDAAKNKGGWFDVVSPITRRRLEALSPPKSAGLKRKSPKRTYWWEIFPIIHHASRSTSEKEKKKQARRKRSYVYLIKAMGLDGIYKIGQSVDPQRRLRDLQRCCPVLLKVEYTITNKRGTNIEGALHKHFRHCRIHNEWFRLSTEDIGWIYRNYNLKSYKGKKTAEKTNKVPPATLTPQKRKAAVKNRP